MGRQNEWSRYPMTKEPTGVGQETEVKYAIPYGWGALHVTDLAHQAYDLQPLTPDKVSEDEIDITEPMIHKNRVDVYLLSPDEFADKVPGESSQQPDSSESNLTSGDNVIFGVSAKALLHQRGAELYLGLSHGTADIKKAQLEGLERFAQAQSQDVESLCVDDRPAIEVLNQMVSQEVVHRLSDVAGITAGHAMDDLLQTSNRKDLWRTMKLSRNLGIVGVAAALCIDVNNQLLENSLVLGYLGTILSLEASALKKYLMGRNKINDEIGEIATLYERAVQQGIHGSYCSHSFNRKTQALFDQS